MPNSLPGNMSKGKERFFINQEIITTFGVLTGYIPRGESPLSQAIVALKHLRHLDLL